MRCLVLVLTALACAACLPARADEVLFKNGDRLTGTIVSVADETLTVDSWSAGTVTVELARVSTFETDEAVDVQLRDGTVVRQRVLASEEGHVRIESDGVLEAQAFALSDILAINPPPQPAPRWHGQVTAGVTITRSDTDSESANLSVGLTRETPTDRVTVDAQALYGRSEDPNTGERSTTEDSWSLDGKYDYYVSERVFVYANGGIERDDVLSLDLRLIAGAGVGRDWLGREDVTFRTEAGLSWLYEDFADEGDSTDTVTARLAYALTKRFNDRVAVRHSLAWYPALDDVGDYFLTAELGVRVTLSELMFGDVKVLYDRDSTPAAGVDEASLKSILGLGMSF